MPRHRSVLSRGATDFYTVSWCRISVDCLSKTFPSATIRSKQNTVSKVWIGISNPSLGGAKIMHLSLWTEATAEESSACPGEQGGSCLTTALTVGLLEIHLHPLLFLWETLDYSAYRGADGGRDSEWKGVRKVSSSLVKLEINGLGWISCREVLSKQLSQGCRVTISVRIQGRYKSNWKSTIVTVIADQLCVVTLHVILGHRAICRQLHCGWVSAISETKPNIWD